MTDINVDELGPVDCLVVAFPAEKANFSGEVLSELTQALVASCRSGAPSRYGTSMKDGTVQR